MNVRRSMNMVILLFARARSERRAIDLVRPGQRQLGHQEHAPGMLIRGPVGQRPLLHGLLAQARARARDNEGHRHLALQLVVYREHRGLQHVRVALQRALHVSRVDVLAAADEHVVGAADEVVETVGVAAADVARVEPAVLQAPRRLLRQVVIGRHHARVAREQHAFIGAGVEADLAARQWVADGRRRARLALRVIREHHRARLGYAVAVGGRRVRERAVERLEERGRGGRGADADEAHRALVGLGERRVVQDQVEHGRHAGEARDPVAADGFHVEALVEAGQQHERGARGHADLGPHERVLVVERGGDEDAVVGRHATGRHERVDLPGLAGVGQQHALRAAGGAGGVGLEADVLGRGFDCRERAGLQEVGVGGVEVYRGDVGGDLAVGGVHEQQGQVGVLGDEGQRLCGELDVERNRDRAGAHRAIERGDVLRAVEGEDADAVAAGEATRG